MIPADITELYKSLGMPYDAVDSDDAIPHLIRLLEELVRRDKLLGEIAENQLTAQSYLQEAIKMLREWIKLIRERTA